MSAYSANFKVSSYFLHLSVQALFLVTFAASRELWCDTSKTSLKPKQRIAKINEQLQFSSTFYYFQVIYCAYYKPSHSRWPRQILWLNGSNSLEEKACFLNFKLISTFGKDKNNSYVLDMRAGCFWIEYDVFNSEKRFSFLLRTVKWSRNAETQRGCFLNRLACMWIDRIPGA